MAEALLDAYRTGSPEAMSRHYAFTWHRRSWSAMRTYVQLDLGKRSAADGTDVDITLDDASDTPPKPGSVTIGNEKARRIVASTRVWSTAIGLMADGQATGLDAHNQMTDAMLERLSHVTRIEELRLGNSKAVSDDGVRHLARLPRLRHLDLSMTAVTDRGLAV